MLKKAKINVMVIIGMMVAVGTVAFTAPEKFAAKWYEEDSNGYLVELQMGPQGDCNETLSDGLECAIQLYEPITSPTKRVDVQPSEIQDYAFTEEN